MPVFSGPAVLLALVLANPGIANAADIKVWTARAIATVLAEIGPQFERLTGHRVRISSGLPAESVQRAKAGEPFDLVITGSAPLDGLIMDGNVLAETRNIARSGQRGGGGAEARHQFG